MAAALAVPAVLVLFLTGTVLLGSRDWRASIAALSIQYVGVFILVAISWPVPESAVKLIAGWMAGAVLGLALINQPEVPEPVEKLTGAYLLFRALLAALAGMAAYSLAEALIPWMPTLSLNQATGGLLLIGLGLLHLGLTSQPLRVILGLLTVLGGFEIIYAALEGSILVAGLLAAITLGLAMVGAYLVSVLPLEEAEQ